MLYEKITDIIPLVQQARMMLIMVNLEIFLRFKAVIYRTE